MNRDGEKSAQSIKFSIYCLSPPSSSFVALSAVLQVNLVNICPVLEGTGLNWRTGLEKDLTPSAGALFAPSPAAHPTSLVPRLGSMW